MPAGRSPSLNDRRLPSRPTTAQCTKVPLGASGSSTTTANEVDPAGGSDHASGGDTFSPEQVKRTGMVAPSAKAELVTVRRAAAPAGGVVDEMAVDLAADL